MGAFLGARAGLLMFATKSCASIELRMGRGVVCLGSSVMASAPDLRLMRERGLLVWEEQMNGAVALGAARVQRFIHGARQQWD
jgi:hypothetical protein